MGEGAAISHARLPGIKKPVGLFARLRTPVPYVRSTPNPPTSSACSSCRRPVREPTPFGPGASLASFAIPISWNNCAGRPTRQSYMSCSPRLRSRLSTSTY